MRQLPVFFSILALVSCATAWKRDDRKESLMLPGVSVKAGGHCESSALANAIRYSGYDVSECMIIGGGGALSFMFQKGDFPFVGARSTDVRERFFEASGIEGHTVIPDGKDAGWDGIASLLSRGIPVVLRVDMRYLPYRYGGKYGPAYMSFGAHYVTLFGIDHASESAYVSDTEYGTLQSVSLRDLHKARTSDTRVFPPRAEYCWIEPAKDRESGLNSSIDSVLLARASVKTVIRNYETGALDGLRRYGRDLAEFESYSKKGFLRQPAFEYMAGNIEDFGTGGASFRVLYRDFLEYCLAGNGVPELSPLMPLIDDCISRWHELSASFRQAAKVVGKMNPSERNTLYGSLRETAGRLCDSEERLFLGLKEAEKKIFP